MSHTLIVAVGAAYVWIACEQYTKQDYGIAVMFFGYALAQVGVYMQAK